MVYRVKLNCADSIRLANASADLGLSGDELVKTLVRSFFDRVGVKNPRPRLRNAHKICHTRKV